MWRKIFCWNWCCVEETEKAKSERLNKKERIDYNTLLYAEGNRYISNAVL